MKSNFASTNSWTMGFDASGTLYPWSTSHFFTASARDYTPEGRAGAVQSVKMVIYIVLPMVLASILDPVIIRAVALEPTAEILAKYPSYAGSYLYPYELFLGAAVAAVFIFLPASAVRRDAKRLRAQKLKEIRE